MSRFAPDERPKIVAVVGATATGKTALSIALARKFRGEVVSADSRQVYRGMDLGTGKATAQEQRAARHWLIDVTSPKTQFSVTRYVQLAERAVHDIVRREHLPIICGGTGHYADALLFGQQIPDVKPNAALRAQLERKTPAQLFALLKRLDPVRASSIDPKNPRRLVRAIEIVRATGKPVPALTTEAARYDVLWLGIRFPRAVLAQRIRARLDARLRTGMITEVSRLHREGVSWKRLEGFGLEYRFVSRYLRGYYDQNGRPNCLIRANKTIAKKQMREGLIQAIRDYAKRQEVWFKRNERIRWVRSAREAASAVRMFLKH